MRVLLLSSFGNPNDPKLWSGTSENIYKHNDILEVLNDFGFQPHSYDPFRRTLQQLPGKNPGGGNTILIKKSRRSYQKDQNCTEKRNLGKLDLKY